MGAKKEKELFRFENDPKYREKIVFKNIKDQDNRYKGAIKRIESERDKLSKARVQEITRIANARWQSVANGKIMVNQTEGKIRINQAEALFSSIRGAELNVQTGCRVVTTEQGKSKKHASLGGAALGGIVLGPVGAVAGGIGLGKTKSNSTSVSNQIPICSHIGVMVNIDGFVSEIVLLNSQVDQSSVGFANAQAEAQNIISQLGALAKLPVPSSFLKPEEESSIKSFDSQISQKQLALQDAIANKPTYALPSMYRSEEKRDLSDDEYLAYLKETDAERQSDLEKTREADRQRKAELKEAARKERAKKLASGDYAGGAKTAIIVMYNIVFWGLSLFVFVFSMASFATQNKLLGGIIFLLTAMLINPLIVKIINEKVFRMPRWICIIILVIGFIAGTLSFNSSTNSNSNSASTAIAETTIK